MNVRDKVVEIRSGRTGSIEKISSINNQTVYTVVFDDRNEGPRQLDGSTFPCFAMFCGDRDIRLLA